MTHSILVTCGIAMLVVSGCSKNASQDPIDRVIQKVSDNPFFMNGPTKPILWSTNAPLIEVVTQAFMNTMPFPTHPGKIDIVTNREVYIDGVTFKAILVETSRGQIVMLLMGPYSDGSWVAKVYDEN